MKIFASRYVAGHVAAGLLAGAVALCAITVSGDANAIGPQITAQAGKTSYKMKQQAKAAYKKGKAAMGKGDYATALTNFQQADKLHPGAAPKYQVAVCFDKLNKIPEAAGAYRNFIDSNPSAKYGDRVVAAGQRIAELEKLMIVKVALTIAPANVAGMVIMVDGEPAQGAEFELKPGEHTIVVSAPNHTTVSETITAVAGQPMSIPVTLVAEAAVDPGAGAGEPEGEGEDDPGFALKVAGFSLVGGGVVLGVLTGVFGVKALGSQSDFEETPTNELADDAEDQALLADVFLGIGGAMAIGGAVLLYLGYSAGGQEEGVASAVPKLVPYAGPNGAGTMATWTF
jgi:hypothetical protein